MDHLSKRTSATISLFLNVKLRDGERLISMEVTQNQTIRELKNVVGARLSSECLYIKPEQQLLIFAGKRLKDHMKTSDYNIQHESTIFAINTEGMLCTMKILVHQSRTTQCIRSLPVSLESNNPPKTQIDDVDGFEFESAFKLQNVLQSTELIQKYEVDRVPALLNIIESYCNAQALRFGDIIMIICQSGSPMMMGPKLQVDEVQLFRIMKGYGDTSYDGQPVHYGQDFVLQISKDHYLQRTMYHKSGHFSIGSQHIVRSDTECGQTWQIDVVDKSVMGKIVRCGCWGRQSFNSSLTMQIGLTIGGNLPIQSEEDQKNPNNESRNWLAYLGDKEDSNGFHPWNWIAKNFNL